MCRCCTDILIDSATVFADLLPASVWRRGVSKFVRDIEFDHHCSNDHLWDGWIRAGAQANCKIKQYLGHCSAF